MLKEFIRTQDFGHFKSEYYPESPFSKYTRIEITNHGYNKRVYTTKELKTYLLEKSSTFLDYWSSDDPSKSVKFRIPFDKQNEKWRIADELIDIDLPPIVSIDLLNFFNEQRLNFNKSFAEIPDRDKYFMRMLIFPLGSDDVERDKIIEKYKLEKFMYDEQNLNYISDIFNKEGHLLFDVTLKRAALRPIQIIKKPLTGMKYRDINLRIWINSVPCYLF